MQEKHLIVNWGQPRTPSNVNLDVPFADHPRTFGRTRTPDNWPGTSREKIAGTREPSQPLPFPSATEDLFNEVVNTFSTHEADYATRFSNIQTEAEQRWQEALSSVPLDTAGITVARQAVTVDLMAKVFGEYTSQLPIAYEIDGYNLFYLAETLAMRKVRALLMGDLTHSYEQIQNSFARAYTATLEVKRLSLIIDALTEKLESLAQAADEEEYQQHHASNEWALRLQARLTRLAAEREIHLQRLPHFLQNALNGSTGDLSTYPLAEQLDRQGAALSRLAEVERAAVGAYTRANPHITPPLSRPETEALKNLVDLQTQQSLGPRWADYHQAALHTEAARQLDIAAKALSRLSQRAQAANDALRAAAEAARIAAEQAAIDSALTAPLHHTLSADAAIARPLFFSAVATYPVIENAGASISASLRTGLAVLADFAQATSKGAAVGIGLLLYSPKLGNAERMERTVTSIPLSLIAPELAAQLAAAAAAVDAQHTVSMPVRLATTPVPTEEAKSTLVVVKTGEAVRANVKAVYATHDPATKTYTAQTAEQPPRTLTWTPAISPPDSSTALPGESTIPENYDGPVVEPIEAKLLESPQPEPLDFDDLVVIFPADSGLPPIYVMYKSPRYEPGVVTGSGQVVGEDWLSATATIGAPIPTQIAEQLIGLRFSSFDGLRRAVWRAIAQDPVLNAHFRSTQLPNMEKGLSPLVPKAQWRGKRKVMEVHHKNLISQGGAVYDLDNLFIMTPNAHVNIHRKGD